MKAKLLTLTFVLSLSSMAQATWSKQSVWSNNYSANEVVNALNVAYPELDLSVAKPADDKVILDELSDLRDIINGQRYKEGQLIHLACSAPACGGDGKGKGK